MKIREYHVNATWLTGKALEPERCYTLKEVRAEVTRLKQNGAIGRIVVSEFVTRSKVIQRWKRKA